MIPRVLLCCFHYVQAISLAVLAYWRKVDGSDATSVCADPMSTEVFKILRADYEGLSYSNVGSSVVMGFSGMLDAVGAAFFIFCK